MNFFSVKALPKKEVKEGIRVCSAFLRNVMLTYFEFEQGAKIPPHNHPHEQITFVLEGEMEFILGGKTKILRAGEGVTVPSEAEHSVCALTRVKVVDAWNPVREDYIVSE